MDEPTQQTEPAAEAKHSRGLGTLMTNDEGQMTKEARMTNSETETADHSSLGFRNSFVIWPSSFVIAHFPPPTSAASQAETTSRPPWAPATHLRPRDWRIPRRE